MRRYASELHAANCSKKPYRTAVIGVLLLCGLLFGHSARAQEHCFALDSLAIQLSTALLKTIDQNSIIEPKRTEPFAMLVVLAKDEESGLYHSMGVVSAAKYYIEKIYNVIDSVSRVSLQRISVSGGAPANRTRLYLQPLLFNHAKHFGAQVRDLYPKYNLCPSYYYDKSLTAVISSLRAAGNVSLLYPILMEGDKRVMH